MNIVISSRQFSLLGQYWADHFLLIALCFARRGSGLGLIWMDWYVIVSWHLVHTEKVEQLCFLNEAVKYSVEHGRIIYYSLAWLATSTLPCCSVYIIPDIYISLPSRVNFIKSIVFPLERWDLFSGACGRLQGDVDFLPELSKNFPPFPTFPPILYRSYIFYFTDLTESELYFLLF